MAKTVVGMFDNTSDAQKAVEKLADHGITRDRVDVSGSGTSGSSYTSASDTNSDEHESGITKFFKNLFGDDDDQANKYTHVGSRSQSIVTVHAQSDEEAERAADILDDNGAVNVDERASAYGYSSGNTNAGIGSTSGNYADTSRTVGAFDSGTPAGVTGTASTATDFSDAAAITGLASETTGLEGADRTTDNDTANWAGNDITSNDENKKIPIIEENLEVGKREVQSGGVRLRSRIVERPVEESIRLREERVNVERTNVDRPATAADFENFKERDIEMIERAEVPVVNKQARVVEEVSLNKEVDERSETINDTVRKTEVDVENLESNDIKNKTNKDY